MSARTSKRPRANVVTIDPRIWKNGKDTTYRLRWRCNKQLQIFSVKNDEKLARDLAWAIENKMRCQILQDDKRLKDASLINGEALVSYVAPTLGTVGDEYISGRVAASQDSRDRYRHTLHNDLAPLVRRPIDEITEDEIRTLLVARVDANKSARAMFDLLCMIFKFAAYRGLLSNGNPCTYIKLPETRRKVGVYLTTDEAGWMIDKCGEDSNSAIGATLADLVDVLLYTGLRISEALGLIVDDVNVNNLDNAWIDISSQLARPTKANPTLRRVPVKTDAGNRRVSLDPETAQTIARRIVGLRPDAPVFADPVDGGFWRQSRVNNAWERARKKARNEGMAKNPRLHDLRHTHASWQIGDHIEPLAIIKRMGHSSITILYGIYGHLMAKAQDEVKSALVSRRAAMRSRKPNPTTPSVRRTTRTELAVAA